VADFSEESDRVFFLHYYLSIFTVKRLTLRMRNTRKMRTDDLFFSKTLKILSKIRSFFDKMWSRQIIFSWFPHTPQILCFSAFQFVRMRKWGKIAKNLLRAHARNLNIFYGDKHLPFQVSLRPSASAMSRLETWQDRWPFHSRFGFASRVCNAKYMKHPFLSVHWSLNLSQIERFSHLSALFWKKTITFAVQ